MPVILAVDPGLTGALAWLDRRPDGGIDLLAVVDMPTAKARQGKSEKSHVQPHVLAAVMGNPALRPVAVVVEDVHAMPGQGVTSMFRFGYAAGIVAGTAAGLGYPLHTVRPNEWQPLAGVRKGDDAGRLRAAQLFPQHATLFARKMDHNRADAALIGYAFCRKNF